MREVQGRVLVGGNNIGICKFAVGRIGVSVRCCLDALRGA